MKTYRLLLIEALESAGRILLEAQGKVREIKMKGHQDAIVTEADLKAESCIVDLIRSHFPHHGIIAEETGKINNEAEYVWVIDPLDGTSNFTAGVPLFGVSICIMHQNTPLIGGTLLPYFSELFFAEKGYGATLNGVPIRVTDRTEMRDVLIGYPIDASDVPGKVDEELRLAGKLIAAVRSLRMFNAATVELCYVACGRLGGILTRRCQIWDIAAGALIVQEAGGIVTDFSGNPLNFDDPDKTFEFIASNRPLYKLIAAMAYQGSAFSS